MNQIGRSIPPLDWEERTAGATNFTMDLRIPGMLSGCILRSPYPHALVTAIDTAEARAMPGVAAIVTAADFPAGIRYRHEGAADRSPLADGAVRFVGQEVAAVAAETRAQAEAAARAIQIRYRPLPAPLNIHTARKVKAPLLHKRPTGRANVSIAANRLWGDPAAGRAESRFTADGIFWFPQQAHACMEPGTTIAHWSQSEQRLHLHSSTNAPYYVVREVAHVLGLREDQVVCHEVGIGGSFGAKSKVSDHEAITAALSRAAGRPVRISLSRAEEFATTKTRHGVQTWVQVHADSEGRLRAFDSRVVVDNGAYNHSGGSVMGAAVKALGMIYRPDGIAVEAVLVDTAKQPGGQFRGYGTTQTSFAMESVIDDLAAVAGWDPLDLRRWNANGPGTETLMGAKLGSARLDECLVAAAGAIGWQGKRVDRPAGYGVGIAAGVHTSGSFAEPGANRCEGAVDIFATGRVRVRFGGGDAGTGQKTILAQIAAEELCIPVSRIDVLSMDSDLTPFDMGAWSSRGTHYTGHATRCAARAAAAGLRALAAPLLGNAPAVLEDGFVRSGSRAIAIGALVGTAGVLSFDAEYVEAGVELPDRETGRGNISASYNFAAHAAFVHVDSRTGAVRVVDYVAAHDLGRAINPTLTEGQIVGGVVMGLGAALGEEMVYEQGRVVNPAFIHYAVPRAGDLPTIRTILVDGDDPHGPYGAKAVGELGVNPVAPAIANAVFNAVGLRIRALPITPDKIIEALAAREGRRRNHALWRRPDRWWIVLVRWLYPRGLFCMLHRRAGPLAAAAPVAITDVAMPLTMAALLEACAGGATPIGGGTDGQLQRSQGLLRNPHIVLTIDVPGMGEIARLEDGSLRIGGAVTLKALVEAGGVLGAAAGQIASPQIRAAATVAGNLLQAKRCWFFRNDFPCYKRVGGLAPCYAVAGDHRFQHAVIGGTRCQAVTPSDLAGVLMGLDAMAVLHSITGTRTLAIGDFYTGPGETVLMPGEVLTEIRIPSAPPARRTCYRKLRLWEGDFAIASVTIAATIDPDGVWHDPRIVLGGVAPVPLRARHTERRVAGSVVTAASLHRALDAELDAIAHPLPRNGWKLDAVAGLAEHVADQLAMR